jgi:hypothetical protein
MTTNVWVVAIERYGPPGAMDKLNFPVPIGDHAFDLIEKVHARDRQARIVFNQSLSENPVTSVRLQGLQDAGVEISGATSSELGTAVENLKSSDNLIVYWIGHGFMAGNRRLVLCAESRFDGNLVAIEIDSILTRLRSPGYASTQIGFFDVCAHFYTTPPTTVNLGGAGKVPKEQFFYFSAAAAETASVTPGQPGFSSTVIDAVSDPATYFPPEPVALFDKLRTRFSKMKLGSRAFPLQRTEHSGSEWTSYGVGYGKEMEDFASEAHCDVALFDHLHQQVAGTVALHELSAALRHKAVDELVQRLRKGAADQHVPNLLEDGWNRIQIAERLEQTCVPMHMTLSTWLSLYRQIVASDSLQDGPEPDNLAHMFVKVMSQPRERGGDSLVRLLELAARKIRPVDPARANKLQLAVRDDPVLGARYSEAVKGLPHPTGPVFLLLGIGIALDGSPSVEGSWVYVNGENDLAWKPSCAQTKLPNQVSVLVEQAKRLHADRDLVVELLAPIELLCCPKELFEVSHGNKPFKVWLEKISAFTLRWHDRMKPGDEFFSGTWKQQAAAAKRRASTSESLRCTWAGEFPLGDVVGIPFPGPSLDAQGRNGQAYFDLLAAGAPYMCWPRTQPADLDVFKHTVSAFVGAHPPHESRFAKLAEALKVAKAAGDPMLGDLWLFVDEPERNPYDDRYVELNEQGTP